jgi:protease-4
LAGVLGWLVYWLRGVLWLLGGLRRRLAPVAPWVYFLIEAPPPQLPPPRGPFWQRFLGPGPTSMWELGEQMRQAAADPRVRGVLIQLRPVPLTAAQGQALAGLLQEVRQAGKRVTCWATSYSQATYPVACAADEVLLAPGGEVAALGVGQMYVHLKDALDRLGVEAQLVQITPYKTAGDALTKSEMTREAREMAEWLADSALADLSEQVGSGRRLSEDAARRLVEGSPYTDEQALAAGAVDGLLTEEALPGRLGGRVEAFHVLQRRLRRPPPPRPGRRVGLLRIEGAIVDGRTRRAPLRPPVPLPLVFDSQAGDLSVVSQARRLAANRRVGAVVLWVDSGGGSATASFAMAAALEALAAAKPLVVAMGSLAASGGYAVSAPAHRIYAQPGTLTGSIGVLGGKIAVAGLLDRLLVRRTTIERGGPVSMFSPDRPYTEEELARLRSSIERSYRVFLEEVGRGRRRPAEEIEPVAGGRVWTGRQALGHQLVDELGGLDTAVAEARRMAGLRPDAPVLRLRAERGELAPPVGAGVGLAVDLVTGLARSPAWWLCPLLSRSW